ncbi:MAG: triple tyrosine motif-containing protein [Agriterribacter sp.]
MKVFLLSLAILLLSINVAAQNTIGLPLVANFNNTIYKGGTQTWDIKQDKSGRMYFANNEGLLIYDGSYWKTYAQPNKTILRSVALDGERIYAGGQDEIGYFAPDEHGVLRYTSLIPLLPKGQEKFTDVWEIEIFKGSVFFRTWNWIFEYKGNAVYGHSALSGWHILKKVGDRLIAQDKKNGIFEFTGGKWQPLLKDAEAPAFEITGIALLGNDSLLLSTLGDGLYIYHKGSLTRKKTSLDDNFIKSHIYCFEQINNNEFIAGTTSQGCVILNAAGTVVQKIARAEGLQNNNVLCAFIDRQQNLWLGLDNGISFIGYSAPIKYIKPQAPEELSGYSIKIFNDQLYIGTSDGAYVAPLSVTARDLSFSKGIFQKIENSNGQVWRFDEVNRQLLMGHHNGSFLISKNKAQKITGESGSWLFMPLSSIYPSQNVLVGTYAGLTMLDFKHNDFVNAGEIKGMYESLRFLAIDNSNVIWASHPYRGIYKIILSPDKKSFTYSLYTEKEGLPSTFRNNVFRVKNNIVFATEKGIYEFDEQQNRFVKSHLLYNLFGDLTIQYLNEDEEGNIWFCSGKKMGVISYKNERAQLVYFPELEGKILSGFESIYPYNSENIFIASNTGIIHLNYKKYIAGNVVPDILITQIKLTGKKDSVIYDGFLNAPADSSNTNKENRLLHFNDADNSFHFEFSSPAYGLSNNISYSYQLKGYDQQWSTPTLKTEKDYTNLPEGSYTFKVKALDNFGNLSPEVSYSFVINHPWYKTPWAYTVYTLLLVGLGYAGYKWQQQQLNRQLQKFEEEQKRLRYIHQLEVEKNEKEIIKLQNEKLINEVIYKNKELADVSLHLVERTDALVKVKDELQRLQKKTGGNLDVKRVIQLVDEIEKNDANWEQFAVHFDEINNDFIKKLKKRFPLLTSTDLKVCAYLQLKLASKEIAQLMNISVRGVEISRYRLRKKLQIPAKQTLNDFLNDIHLQAE